MHFLATLSAATILTGLVVSHPGHDATHEMEQRATFMKSSKRDLSHCAAKMKARGLEQRAVVRRSAVAKEARRKRNIESRTPFLKARDNAATLLNTTHLSSVDYNPTTDESVIFAGNSSCILSPEVTQGPYYVSGEYVRENSTETQQGVELILDTQVIDMATCDPVTDAVIEIWSCNATGVYSGIVTQGNGDSSDTANINTTFLRSLQPTDAEGVAQFTSIVPGHYTSRATHFHVLAHFNGTTYPNGTYNGGYVSHVGQLFFDQDLITQVEATAPYNTNTQELTLNSDDSVFAAESVTGDPFVNYSFLGDTVESGVFGWISFGIDLTNEQTLTSAASLYAEGGVASSSSGVGGGGGGGNGTSGGAPPS